MHAVMGLPENGIENTGGAHDFMYASDDTGLIELTLFFTFHQIKKIYVLKGK